MIPKRIAGATRYLGAPQGWDPELGGDCSHLAILDAQMDGGMPVMISAWEPTPVEIARLVAGKPLYLQVVGTAHPPVNVWVRMRAIAALFRCAPQFGRRERSPDDHLGDGLLARLRRAGL